MSFIPAVCLSCLRVTLVSLTEAGQRLLACSRCGSEAQLTPSCSYGDADREEFEELSCVVAEGNLSRSEAQVRADTISRALWSGSFDEHLERLCQRMPGLLPMQIAAGRNRAAQRRILVKLQSILQALATVPRGSGEYTLVAAEAGGSAVER